MMLERWRMYTAILPVTSGWLTFQVVLHEIKKES
jgi:hypothetical protein